MSELSDMRARLSRIELQNKLMAIELRYPDTNSWLMYGVRESMMAIVNHDPLTPEALEALSSQSGNDQSVAKPNSEEQE